MGQLLATVTFARHRIQLPVLEMGIQQDKFEPHCVGQVPHFLM